MKIYEIEKEYRVDSKKGVVDIFYTVKKNGQVICNKVELQEFKTFFQNIEEYEKGKLLHKYVEKKFCEVLK